VRANALSPDELAVFKSAEHLQRKRGSAEGMAAAHEKAKALRMQSLQLRWALAFFALSLLGSAGWVKYRMYKSAKQPVAVKPKVTVGEELSAEAKQQLLPRVLQSLAGFIQANNAVDKARFVSNSSRWVAEMQRYYQGKLGESFESVPKLLDMQLLPVAANSPKRLATQWQLQPKKILEICYVADEEGNWLIDWPYFVRQNAQDWSSFLRGEAAAEGNFRLSLKLRQPYSKGDKTIKLAFYEANGQMGDWQPGRVSCDLEISIGEAERSGLLPILERKTSAGLFGSNDVEKTLRVMVNLQRIELGYGSYTLKLQKVLAADWFAHEQEPFSH